MKISVLTALLLFVAWSFVFANSVMAKSNINISNNSNFSPETKDFSGNQTVFVRVKYDTDYSQINLILDDNNSNPLKTVTMNKVDDHTYSGSLTAPSQSNYYLIRVEASEGEGKKSTIVRTIKVGNTISASLNVNIDTKASGQKTTNGEGTTTPNTTTHANLNTTNGEGSKDSDDNISITRQEITPVVKKIEGNRILKAILFVTNPILFATLLLLS